jgi:acyl-CoA thioesterase FadM
VNLYLRLLLTLLKALRAPRIAPGEVVELRLCVLPNDLDLNGHMNNGRYLTMVDLALATVFIRSGFARLCLARRWRPMGGGSIVYFRKALTVFQRFTLRFSVTAWDEFWSYCRFEFVRDGLVRAAEIYPALGFDGPSPPMPEDLLAWIAADRLQGERVRTGAG